MDNRPLGTTVAVLVTLPTACASVQFTPASPTLRPSAFDHDDYIFELKMDGFRALAYFGADETRLVSREGNVYKSFSGLCAATGTVQNVLRAAASRA